MEAGHGYAIPKIKKIIYPNTIIKIVGNSNGDSSYYNNSLNQVVLPNNLQEIGKYAFYGCTALTNIEIPSTVTSIGYEAFYGSSGLTSIGIPSSVTRIEEWVFYECSSLKTVNYTGTMAQWQQISIVSYNMQLTNATIICTDGTINQ